MVQYYALYVTKRQILIHIFYNVGIVYINSAMKYMHTNWILHLTLLTINIWCAQSNSIIQ